MLCLSTSQQPTTPSDIAASALAAGQTYGFFYHGTCSKSQLYPHHRQRPPKQVATSEERRPAGSVLALLLFNIYTYDLPTTISKKFAYADDLAILHSTGDWQTLEGTLTQDMNTLSSYLQKWKLKLSVNKTVTAAFHLYNREKRRELTINVEGRALPFSTTPTYLGVKLDRALTFRPHLESLRKKLTTRVGLLRRLAGSS